MDQNFAKLKFTGRCAVCGKQTDVIALASPLLPVTNAYCRECATHGVEPLIDMVDCLASSNLHYPEDVKKEYLDIIDASLKYQNVSKEDFRRMVDEEAAKYDY